MRSFYAGLVVIALVAAGLIVWQARRAKASTAVRMLDAVDTTGVRPEGHVYGSPTAPVTIVEYADFECPACQRFAVLTEPDVRKRIADSGLANIRFFDFPLKQHRSAVLASKAAACAGDQGRFWEMHDRLFDRQGEWSPDVADVRDPKHIFEGYARDLGVETGRWSACYDSREHLAQIRATQADGERVGVDRTPSFVIGGRLLLGSLTYDQIRAYVDSVRSRAGVAAPASGGARPGIDPRVGGGARRP